MFRCTFTKNVLFGLKGQGNIVQVLRKSRRSLQRYKGGGRIPAGV